MKAIVPVERFQFECEGFQKGPWFEPGQVYKVGEKPDEVPPARARNWVAFGYFREATAQEAKSGKAADVAPPEKAETVEEPSKPAQSASSMAAKVNDVQPKADEFKL